MHPTVLAFPGSGCHVFDGKASMARFDGKVQCLGLKARARVMAIKKSKEDQILRNASVI